MRSRPAAALASAAFGVVLLAVAGCASAPGGTERRRPGPPPSMEAGMGGGSVQPAPAAEPPDLELAIDRLELRGVDLQVTNLELDLGLRLSFLGIVSLDVNLDAGADELTLKVEELLGDVRADARIAALVTVIEDVVTLFQENPDLLQRLQLRMRMGGGGGAGGGGPVPDGGGGAAPGVAPVPG